MSSFSVYKCFYFQNLVWNIDFFALCFQQLLYDIQTAEGKDAVTLNDDYDSSTICTCERISYQHI